MDIEKNRDLWKNLNRRMEWLKLILLFFIIAGMVAGGMMIVRSMQAEEKARVETEKRVALEKEKKENEEKERKRKEEEAKKKEEERIERERQEAERLAAEKKKQEEAKRAEEQAAMRAKLVEAEKEREWKAKQAAERLAGRKLIALTFDDGPRWGTTDKLLDILKSRGVRATFFVLGTSVRGAPDLVRREVAEGHEVQGHTMYHGAFNQMTRAQIVDDLKQADDLLTQIIGRPPQMIRPPYGAMSSDAREVAGRPFMCWDVDTVDWRDRNSWTVRNRVREGMRDGAVVLMHDIHLTSVDAVPGIIDDLSGAGYEFVTVSELAAARGVSLVAGKDYWGVR